MVGLQIKNLRFLMRKKGSLSLSLSCSFSTVLKTMFPTFLEPKVKIERAKSAYHQNKENIHIVCDLRISQERKRCDDTARWVCCFST